MKRIAALVFLVGAPAACNGSVTVQSDGGGGRGGHETSSGGSAGSDTSIGGAGGMGGFASTGGAGGGIAMGGGTGVGGAPPTCPDFGDPCTICSATECAAVYCGCYDEPHCFGLFQCYGTCDQSDPSFQACIQNCLTVHQDGISASALLSDCAAVTCNDACMFGQALNPCQTCLYTSCAEQMNSCIGNPECTALIQCVQMCAPGDMMCGQACVAEHPDGQIDAIELRNCRNDNCGAECQ